MGPRSIASSGWSCHFSHLLKGGAAWFLPSLDGVEVFFCPFGGTTFPLSSVGWCCLVHSSLGWCCVLLCLLSLLWGCFSNLLSGGPAFLPLWVELLFPSSVGWCCLVSCFFGWCCDFSSPLAWSCLTSAPLGVGCVHPLFFCVVLLSFPFLSEEWCFSPPLRLGGVAWSPPPLGDVAFPLSFCVLLPSFPSSGWDYFSLCLLLGGTAWSTRVVLRCFFFFCVVLPFFPSIWRSCDPPFCWVLLLGFPPLGGVAVANLLLSWCCLPSPPLGGGAAFLSSSSVGWCCLVSSFFGWCCFSNLLSGGAAFPFSG